MTNRKHLLFSLVVLLFTTLIVFSCRKDTNNNNEDSLKNKLFTLKAVSFKNASDEVLESKKNRDLGGGRKELIQIVKKTIPIDPVEIIDETKLDIIYPGSILRGDSFMEGSLDPIALNNPKKITISISLQGKGYNVKRTAFPSVSSVRQQMNSLTTDEKIDFDRASSNLKYEANSVSTKGSFNKTFRTHARASVLFGLAKSSFQYETSELSVNQTKYVLIKVRQFFYNIVVDPKPYDQWGDMETSNLGSYEPLYISSVDYGRVAHLLVKTDMSASEVSNRISGSIRAGWFIVKTGGSVDKEDKTNKMFESEEIKIITLGGPLGYGKIIKDLDSFMHFLMVPSAEDLIKSAVPIGYKVRTLRDNKEVEVHSFYTEQKIVRE